MKTHYIEKVADITNRPYEEVEENMVYAKKELGVSFVEYYNNELYNLSFTQQTLAASRLGRKRKRRQNAFKKIITNTGLPKKEIIRTIKSINEEFDLNLNVIAYAKFEVYQFSNEELVVFVKRLKRRNYLKKHILEMFDEFDLGNLECKKIEPYINELYSLLEDLMPDSLKEELYTQLTAFKPEILNDQKLCNSFAVDMEATRFLFGYTITEYLSFHFSEKTIYEKRAFLSDIERRKIIKQVNDFEKYDLLDDKYQTYTHLKEYFKRDIIKISKEDNRTKFIEFCNKHKKVVVKPLSSSFGRGIQLLRITPKVNLEETFDQLLKEYKVFILEELIVAHRRIAKLNPDSVNTIRVVTYFDGEKTILHRPFMKVGQKGSFVDNGGAGGLFVAVDLETGQLNSDGYDEKGHIYERHPSTGIKFKGYKLPKWKSAIDLAIELSTKLPGMNLIGWDMTYDKKRGWIIVEGNAKTQFLAQQCTLDQGLKKEIFELLNIDKNNL